MYLESFKYSFDAGPNSILDIYGSYTRLDTLTGLNQLTPTNVLTAVCASASRTVRTCGPSHWGNMSSPRSSQQIPPGPIPTATARVSPDSSPHTPTNGKKQTLINFAFQHQITTISPPNLPQTPLYHCFCSILGFPPEKKKFLTPFSFDIPT